MSWKHEGSGRKSRIRGSRCRARSSRATPRPSSSSSTSASIDSPSSGGRRQPHGWPVTDRSILSASPMTGLYPCEGTGPEFLESAVLEVAIFCGYAPNRARAGAHDDALGRHAIAPPVHALQQRAVGHARRREDAVALGHLIERVDALQIVDPPAVRAGDFIVVAEHEA